MKRLLILPIFLLSLSLKAQTQYNVYMDSLGTVHINTNKSPQVAISGYYDNLSHLPTLAVAPTIYPNVTRPVNSTTFTVSTTRDAEVFYNVSITCTATIGGTASGSVALQTSTNGGSTWTTIGTVGNSNTVTLAVALNSVTLQQGFLVGFIPANSLVRMVSTSSGSTVINFNYGSERY